MSVLLRPISRSAADALLARREPTHVEVAADHPTEFSAGIAEAVGGGSPLGPFFVHRAHDEVVIGEIGGGFIAADTVEIGYALVPSRWGVATRPTPCAHSRPCARRVRIARIVANTPLDRPASGRVLEKAGFALVGEADDEHEGAALRVRQWELGL